MKRGHWKIMGGLIGLLLIASGFLTAAQYDLKEMTPAVERAISNRQARYQELQLMKQQGLIGENNRGYLAVLSGDDRVRRIVAEENDDRRAIYQAVVDQNHLGPSEFSIVETVFAEVQREKSRPGDPFQLASGEWTKH
ncbi:MAG: YdbL family protein [Candidatus Omnitrophota bacterium]